MVLYLLHQPFVGPTQPVDAIYMYICSKTCNRISGNFHNDIIFAISFTSQNIHYTEIISCIVCYQKIKELQKMTEASRNITHIPKFCDTKNTRYTIHCIYLYAALL